MAICIKKNLSTRGKCCARDVDREFCSGYKDVNEAVDMAVVKRN